MLNPLQKNNFDRQKKGVPDKQKNWTHSNKRKKLGPQKKRSSIRETKHLLTDADSTTYTKNILLVRQNSQKEYNFFARQFYTIYEQKYSNLRPPFSITFPQGFQNLKPWTLEFGKWGQKDN